MAINLEKKEGSIYSPLMYGELERLSIQARLTREADMPCIMKLKNIFQNKERVCILDVGCGYGVVAKDRFSDWTNIFVVGIDYQEGVLEMAREINGDSNKFVFEQVNIEDNQFEEAMKKIMRKYDIEGFDIIFGAYVLQHLENPINFLKKCRFFLHNDGYVLFRNTADKSTISYGDNGLIQEIQNRTELAPGNAARDIGLQLHHHLCLSGYKDIQIFGFLKDISNMTKEQRMEIYRERFSWRNMYFKLASEKNPNDEWLHSEYLWMEEALEKLKIFFEDPKFWYGETIINALAKNDSKL